jgi:kelch-like protein 17 (actinfilin)/kelch-like protein 20
MKRWIWLLTVLGAATLASAEWLTVPPLPVARVDGSAVSTGDAVYFLGGSDRRDYFADVYRFREGAWTAVASLPVPLAQAAATFDGGKIYVAGGVNRNGVARGFHSYDVSADQWTTGAELPAARYGGRMVAVDGTLYFIGGADAADQPSQACYRFDAGTGEWEVREPMAVARKHHGLVVADGKIWAIGGIGNTAAHPRATDSVEIYYPGAGLWLGGPTSTDWWGGAVGIGDGKLWRCGGVVSGEVVDRCEATATNDGEWQWNAAESLPFVGYRLAGGNALLAAGGERLGERGYELLPTVTIWRDEPTDDDDDDDNDDNDDSPDDDDDDNDNNDDDNDDESPPADDDSGEEDRACGCR